MTYLERENAELKKELRDAKMERDILKKGAASSPRAMENLPVYKRSQHQIYH